MLTDAVQNSSDPTPYSTPDRVLWNDQDVALLVEVLKQDRPVIEVGKAFQAKASAPRSYAAMVRQISKMSEEARAGISMETYRRVQRQAAELNRMQERNEIDIEIDGVRWINAARANRLFDLTAQQMSDSVRRGRNRLRRKEYGEYKRWIYHYDDVVAYFGALEESRQKKIKAEVEELSSLNEKSLPKEERKPKPEPEKKAKKPIVKEASNHKPNGHTNGHTNGHAKGSNGHTNGHTKGYSNGHTNGKAHDPLKAFTEARVVKPTVIPRDPKQQRADMKDAIEKALATGLLTPDELMKKYIDKFVEADE